MRPEAGRTGAILEVDLGAIVANWRLLGRLHPSGPVAGVVKADGYGLGARQVATALYAAGCRHFFVALLDEALAIRDIVPGALLAVLDGLIPCSEAEYLEHGLVPALGSLAEINAWTEAARAAGRRLPAILHIDTGMARLGLDARELAVLQQDHGRLAGIDLRYVMTHLVSSEAAGDPLNQCQRERFAAACAGLPPGPRSFANSSGIFLGPGWGSDLARPGAALYGINPTPDRPNPMELPVRLRARVLAVRDVSAGDSAGYNATWRAPRPSRVATAAIGYADGWHRSLSGRGRAFFDGTPVPLVGRVSMDLTTFDVTDVPGVVPGAWLELIGPAQTPDDVAAAAGTNGYEVLTSLGRRFHRVYRPA
ncbi:MAG TPA: alanine racemase [Acetobacteraceae bacterium]|jgi:alanine racemase|nr:alanine racemase [Acetobacteraceae bacterium]